MEEDPVVVAAEDGVVTVAGLAVVGDVVSSVSNVSVSPSAMITVLLTPDGRLIVLETYLNTAQSNDNCFGIENNCRLGSAKGGQCFCR